MLDFIFFASGGPTLIYLVSGVLLWIYTHQLLQFLLPKSSPPTEDEPSRAITNQELQGTLFAVVGIVLIIVTIPQFFQVISNLVNMNAQPFPAPHLKGETIIFAIQTMVQLGIGAFLVLGNHGLSKLLFKIRDVGTTKKEDIH